MTCVPLLSFKSVFVPQVSEEMKSESKPIKIDRRLTGSNIIDEPLQQVLSTQPNRPMNTTRLKVLARVFEEHVVSLAMRISQTVESVT